jgi:hypothetical protein
MRRLPQPVVNGVKQRALFGWHSHLCTANGPSAKAMGTHGPLDPAAPEGKTGAARDGPREACLISADPRDTGQYSLRDVARRGLLNLGSNCARTLDEERRSGFGEPPSLKRCNCLYN